MSSGATSPRQSTTRGIAVFLAVALVLLVASTLLDHALFHALRVEDRARLERRDWYQALRQLGYLPTWLALAAAIFGHHLWRLRRGLPVRDITVRGALLLPAAAALAGLAAEVLKRVIGRERPGPEGEYIFKPLFGALSDPSNMGVPSSHAATAFGAAFLVARLYPGACVVAVALAAGCGLTRMLTGAHFLSDTVAGALLGFGAAWVLGRSLAPREKP